MKGIYCTLFSDNFLNSLALIYNTFWGCNSQDSCVRSNQKQMLKLKEHKKMSCCERDFHYSKNIICCKWWNSKLVLPQAKNVDGVRKVSITMRETKGSETKTFASCPNIIVLCNNGMGGIDGTDDFQRAGARSLEKGQTNTKRKRNEYKSYIGDNFLVIRSYKIRYTWKVNLFSERLCFAGENFVFLALSCPVVTKGHASLNKPATFRFRFVCGSMYYFLFYPARKS